MKNERNIPKVHLVMVSSLDGVIAKNSNEFVDWSTKEDKKYFSDITKEKGCWIMGSSTFKTIGRALPGRLNVVMTRDVEKMKSSYTESKELIFVSPDSILELLKNLYEMGYKEVVLGGGTSINTQFAKENLIDFVHLSIEPILVGTGLQIFSEDTKIELKLIESSKLNENTVLLKYEVVK